MLDYTSSWLFFHDDDQEELAKKCEESFNAVDFAELFTEIVKKSGCTIEPKKEIKYVTTYISKPIWNEETGRYIHLELGKYIEVEVENNKYPPIVPEIRKF